MLLLSSATTAVVILNTHAVVVIVGQQRLTGVVGALSLTGVGAVDLAVELVLQLAQLAQYRVQLVILALL